MDGWPSLVKIKQYWILYDSLIEFVLFDTYIDNSKYKDGDTDFLARYINQKVGISFQRHP